MQSLIDHMLCEHEIPKYVLLRTQIRKALRSNGPAVPNHVAANVPETRSTLRSSCSKPNRVLSQPEFICTVLPYLDNESLYQTSNAALLMD